MAARLPLTYLFACALSASAPLVPGSAGKRGFQEWSGTSDTALPFPGWPREWEGRALKSVPLLASEERFYRDFPGKVAKFTDGEREIVMRWASGSRKFHLSRRCYEAHGYAIVPAGQKVDPSGRTWSAFSAVLHNRTAAVQELIYDSRGQSWPDEAAWKTSAFFGRTQGPWWGITLVRCSVDAAEDSKSSSEEPSSRIVDE